MVTLVRKRTIAVLVVGATGTNVLRVMTAFERHALVVARADDVASARDCIVRDLPYVVLSLLDPKAASDGKKLTAIASAVGAVLVELDPAAEDATFRRILEQAVDKALELSGTPRGPSPDSVPSAPPPNFDEGWEK